MPQAQAQSVRCLAPKSAFQEQDRSGQNAANTLRLPSVRPVQQEWLSFDAKIQDAVSTGDVFYVRGLELQIMLERFEKSVLRFDANAVTSFSHYQWLLRKMMEDFQRLFPEAKRGIDIADLHGAMMRALRLLRDGKLELCLVDFSADKIPKISWKKKMGFYAHEGEAKTDNGDDARNLPFLLRRMHNDNRLFMKRAFFEKYVRRSPRSHAVLFQALMHELLEDPRVLKPLGIPQRRAHAFASFMTHALKPVSAKFASDRHAKLPDLDSWMLQFYTPNQLAGLLGYHPGLQATDLRLLALERLLEKGHEHIVTTELEKILRKPSNRGRLEKESDERLLRSLQQHALWAFRGGSASRPDYELDLFPAGWRDKVGKQAAMVMIDLEIRLYERLKASWRRDHPDKGGTHSCIQECVESGVLDGEGITSLATDRKDGILLRNVLHYLSETFEWSRPQDQFGDIAKLFGEYLLWTDLKLSGGVYFDRMHLVANYLIANLSRRFEVLDKDHRLPMDVKAQFGKVVTLAQPTRVLLKQYQVYQEAESHRQHGTLTPLRSLPTKESPKERKRRGVLLGFTMQAMKEQRPEDFQVVSDFLEELKKLRDVCARYTRMPIKDIVLANAAAEALEPSSNVLPLIPSLDFKSIDFLDTAA